MTATAPSAPRIPLIELDPGDARSRGLGVLSVKAPAGRRALPLERVSIAARVAERVASVTISEAFVNPYAEPLEAVYIFPLPGGAAVSDFGMRVAGRIVKGVVQERGEARRQYWKALDDGKRAALLEQERDDVFTVQLGNLPPGEAVSVVLTYSEQLPFFDDGTTEVRLPLVVAPRYIPGAPLDRESVGEGTELDTDVVPDASRITPPRLARGFDPRVALSLEVELVEGGGFDDLACSQHATRLKVGGGAVKIALARENEPLDRDFVLRWRAAGGATRTSLLVHKSKDGRSYGVISIVPPRREGFLGTARDVVFVVDRSGSMEGVKMASAARACGVLLATLGPRDRFAIAAFDDRVDWLEPPRGQAAGRWDGRFVPADEAGLELGHRFLREIASRGGTELDGAVHEALEAIGKRAKTAARAPVVVVLTDGQIGDEARVLKRIQQEIGDARAFTVGIDTAVNDGFLKRLAALGGGTATFVQPGGALEDALKAVGREIGAPLVVNLELEGADGEKIEAGTVAPSAIPDLFAGRASTAFFRADRPGRVRVRGWTSDGARFEETAEPREVELPAIARLWAKARIQDLEDRFRLEPSAQAKIKADIIALSLMHSLLTRFTAFVVVDESEVVNATGERRKVVQPVEEPALWEMSKVAEEHAKYTPRLTCAGMDASMSGASDASLVAGPLPAMSMPAPKCAAPPSYRTVAPGAMGMPPAAPPVAAAGGGGGLGSLGGSVAGALGRVFKRMLPKKGGKDGGSANAKEDAGPSPAERGAIGKALETFAAALMAARALIAAGQVPPAEALEKARAALLKALAGSEAGQRVPLLQRFLRLPAVELVAALGTPGATAAGLRALFERHEKIFVAARAETEAALRGGAAAGAKEEPFWEATV